MGSKYCGKVCVAQRTSGRKEELVKERKMETLTKAQRIFQKENKSCYIATGTSTFLYNACLAADVELKYYFRVKTNKKLFDPKTLENKLINRQSCCSPLTFSRLQTNKPLPKSSFIYKNLMNISCRELILWPQ